MSIGIIGMGCHLGPFATLNDLERALYDGRVTGDPPLFDAPRAAPLLAAEEAVRDAEFDQRGAATRSRIVVFTAAEPEAGAEPAAAVADHIRSRVADPSRVLVGGARPDTVSALDAAWRSLSEDQVTAALVVAVDRAGATAVVLTRADAPSANKPAYAIVDAPTGTRPEHVEHVDLSREPALGTPARNGLLAAIIQAALCLHHCYLPAADTSERSRPWFRAARHTPRKALVSGRTRGGSDVHCVLSGAVTRGELVETDWQRVAGCFLVPVCGQDAAELVDNVERVRTAVRRGADLGGLAHAALKELPHARLRAIFCASGTKNLLRELDRATAQLPDALAAGREWRTPEGSCCAGSPMGQGGKIALVFPGMFSAYPGAGRDLFRCFPGLLPASEAQCERVLELTHGVLPRLFGHQANELANAERALLADLPSVAVVGSVFAWLHTELLRRVLGLREYGVFGYSLGELSMLYATGCWQMSNADRPVATGRHVFKDGPSGAVWGSRLLLADAGEIRARLADHDRVFLTHVNAPAESVVTGDPIQCAALARSLGCPSLATTHSSLLHTPLIDPDDIAPLFRKPVTRVKGVELFSARHYERLDDPAPDRLAADVAEVLRTTVDFPRLVNAVYRQGYRYFLEVGPDATCSRWIRQTLAGLPHVAESVDRRGTSTASSVARLVARLASHGMEVDLSPFVPPLPDRVGPGQPVHESHASTLAAYRENLAARQRTQERMLTMARTSGPAGPSPVCGVLFDERDVLEFSTGLAANVFGPAFAPVDTYAHRVRLPAPPFLFVSRVTAIEGTPGTLEPSFIRTEYDVPHNAWYTVDGQVPAGIVIEMTQSHLFLLGYLGVDLRYRGTRRYRLLGCTGRTHGDLPREGQRVRVDLWIDRFVTTAGPPLLFMRSQVHTDDTLILETSDMCAGMFTDTELAVRDRPTENRRRAPLASTRAEARGYFKPLAHTERTCLGRDEVRELLPDGRLLMIDEVTRLDRTGGEAGLGTATATKRLRPDDWFFASHFPGDPVLPGTLLGEGMQQLVRIYGMSVGLHLCLPHTRFEPVHGREAVIRASGQVLPDCRELRYEAEITEIGLLPRPHLVANGTAFADGVPVARYGDVAVQLREHPGTPIHVRAFPGHRDDRGKPALLNEFHLAHAGEGDLAVGLGPEFAGRRSPRLPNGDFRFVDRVLSCSGARGVFKPGTTMELEYDSPADAWYYAENGQPDMPNLGYLECALQAASVLGTYLGSSLELPDRDLVVRNLEGVATLLRQVDLRGKTIRQRCTLVSHQVVADMILQRVDFQLLVDDEACYAGESLFGFFTEAALSRASGLGSGDHRATGSAPATARRINLAALRARRARPRLPTGRLDLMEQLHLVAGGGKYGAGHLHGRYSVHSERWFFARHFFGDPVMPGSLGVEAALTALRAYIVDAGLADGIIAPTFAVATGIPLRWRYRGQVLPADAEITVDVHIKDVHRTDDRLLVIGEASLWKPGLRIYAMDNVAVEVRSAKGAP